MSKALKAHPVCRCHWLSGPAVLWRTEDGRWWFADEHEDSPAYYPRFKEGWLPFVENRYLTWVEFLPTATEEDKVLIQMARLVGTEPL